MKEEIEEFLHERYEFLDFKINYMKVRTYQIIIDLMIYDQDNVKTLRMTYTYFWNATLTKERNLYNIKSIVNKAISRMFLRGFENE